MRPSCFLLRPLPPSQPPQARARPPIAEPEITRLWYTKYRPWLLTISVGIVVAGGALFGAELKTEYQRRQVRELRALEKAGTTATAGTGEVALEGKGSEALESTAAPAPTQALSEQEKQARDKKIHEYIAALEVRKKEMLMKREEIVVKVRRLQERMKRKEVEQMERERVAREGGTMGRVER